MFTLLCSATLLPAANATAQNFFTQHFQAEPAGGKFSSRETTLDVFGSYNIPENRDFTDGRLGIGVGVNYFFNYYVGAGVDTGVDKFDWPNHINASVIFRYPIEKWSLAPYLFTGFGRQFHDVSQWTYHIAGGVDYRLNPKTGLFADVGRTFPGESRDYTLWRFGIRFRL